jgi:ferredoxin
MIIFYFSGTGNSKYIAELFSQNMDAKCHSIEESVDFAELINQEDIVGFCYPIYGSRVPRLMRDFVIKNMDTLKDKKIIIFCTQLIFSGDGARVLTDLFPQNQATGVIYAEHFFMPNNVCNLFFLPLAGKKLTERYLSKAQKKMQKVCKNISKGVIKKRGFNPVSQVLGLAQGSFMPGIEERAKSKVRIDGDCNQCGICVSLCPMNNFTRENINEIKNEAKSETKNEDNTKNNIENNTISTNNNCIMCYRCINKCPQKAIRVFVKAKVKKQFLLWE